MQDYKNEEQLEKDPHGDKEKRKKLVKALLKKKKKK